MWQTSWGVSTRMVGGLIMAHGDDAGLCIPPRLAPLQAVVIVVRDDDGTTSEAARGIVAELVDQGVRAEVDDRTATSFGRRAADWELKGVPVRVEIGPRDLADDQAVMIRRDVAGKRPVALGALASTIVAELDSMQSDLLAAALARRDAATATVATVAEAREAAATGFARIPWDTLRGDGETELANDAITVRCLVTADDGVPDDVDAPGLTAIVGRSY